MIAMIELLCHLFVIYSTTLRVIGMQKSEQWCAMHINIVNAALHHCFATKDNSSIASYICDNNNMLPEHQNLYLSEKMEQVKIYSHDLKFFINCTFDEKSGVFMKIAILPPNNSSHLIPKDKQCHKEIFQVAQNWRGVWKTNRCTEIIFFLIYGNDLWISMDKNIQNIFKNHSLFKFLKSVSSYEDFSTQEVLSLLVSGYTKLILDNLKIEGGGYPVRRLKLKSKTVMGIVGFLCVVVVIFAFFCATFMRSHISRIFAGASPAMIWQMRRK